MDIYTDPGHGWAKVSVERLIKWGVAHKVSPYSRRSDNGEQAFLEEDYDAPIAYAAFEAVNGRPPKRTIHNADNDSRIRRYRGFCLTDDEHKRSMDNEK